MKKTIVSVLLFSLLAASMPGISQGAFALDQNRLAQATILQILRNLFVPWTYATGDEGIVTAALEALEAAEDALLAASDKLAANTDKLRIWVKPGGGLDATNPTVKALLAERDALLAELNAKRAAAENAEKALRSALSKIKNPTSFSKEFLQRISKALSRYGGVLGRVLRVIEAASVVLALSEIVILSYKMTMFYAQCAEDEEWAKNQTPPIIYDPKEYRPSFCNHIRRLRTLAEQRERAAQFIHNSLTSELEPFPPQPGAPGLQPGGGFKF